MHSDLDPFLVWFFRAAACGLAAAIGTRLLANRPTWVLCLGAGCLGALAGIAIGCTHPEVAHKSFECNQVVFAMSYGVGAAAAMGAALAAHRAKWHWILVFLAGSCAFLVGSLVGQIGGFMVE